MENSDYTKIEQKINQAFKKLLKAGFGTVEIIREKGKKFTDIICTTRERIKDKF